MSDADEARVTLRDGLQVLFMEKRKIEAVLFLTVLAAVICVYMWPETYEAEAKILIKLGRKDAPSADVMYPSSVLVQRTQKEINTEIQIMLNAELIREAVENLQEKPDKEDKLLYEPRPEEPGLAMFRYNLKQWTVRKREQLRAYLVAANLVPDLTAHERLVRGVGASLSCVPAQETNALIATVGWDSPERAERILREIIKLYKREHVEAHKSPDVQKVYAERLPELRMQLEGAENGLAELKNGNGIGDIEIEMETLVAEKNRTETAVSANKQQAAALEAELAVLDERLETMPETVLLEETTVRNPTRQSLALTVAELKTERAKLATTYRLDSPKIKSLDEQIAMAESLLKEQEDEVPSARKTGMNEARKDMESKRVSVKQELEGVLARSSELGQQLARQEVRITTLNSLRPRFENLASQIAQLRKDIGIYQTKAEEARMGHDMDVAQLSSISIVQDVTASPAPVAPRKLLTLGLAVVFGLMFGVGYGLLAHYLDRSVVGREDVEKAGLPFLAAVPDEGRRFLPFP